METKIIKIDPQNPEEDLIDEAVEVLRNNDLVAFPTETVYGLGAAGLNKDAVEKIFKAKNRPQDNPLILHVCSVEMVEEIAENISPDAKKLMDAFWPGPLTIIFKRKPNVPDVITAGLDTVAIRMPDNKIALKLIEKLGMPIAAPSANTSGKPSPTCAKDVYEDMYGKIPLIIDGGDARVGLESTVVDLSNDKAMILRPGGITIDDLERYFKEVELDPALKEGKDIVKPRAPGQKYRHYAPKAQLVLFLYSNDMTQRVNEMYDKLTKENKKVGILTVDENLDKYNADIILSLGTIKDLETIAHNLFKYIRQIDNLGVDVILCEGVKEEGIGLAIMNRLRKSSGGNIA
ncbi:threonylcarbamoyl-AMP synthase [Soehngenia saccharolytica]|nr:threonylcarbamoyl-AMP synthase [Soehngenia saccharolytica]